MDKEEWVEDKMTGYIWPYVSRQEEEGIGFWDIFGDVARRQLELHYDALINWSEARQQNEALEVKQEELAKQINELHAKLSKVLRDRGWVYVVGSHEEGRYKIGMTRRRPRKRLAEFTPKLPFETELICAIKSDDPYSDEAAYHEEFQNQRENGEWFRLSEDNLRWLKLHARLSGGIINEH